MTQPTPNYDLVRVRGTYRNPDGSNAVGSVRFLPTVVVRDVVTNIIVVPGKPLIFDLVNGELDRFIPATDDPDLTPTGWVYKVHEKVPGGRKFDMEAPIATNPGGIFMASVPPAISILSNSSYVSLDELNGMIVGYFNEHPWIVVLEPGDPDPTDLEDGVLVVRLLA